MIDLKQEVAKFKPIDTDSEKKKTGENVSENSEENLAGEASSEIPEEVPELDKDTKDAINYYNKALEQLNNGLEDMAKANLKKSVSLRPDFSHAICLLAACLLSKGDRLGVVRLSSSISDQETKRTVTPYIEYLFGEYDRVEYTKEKKERTLPSIGSAAEAGTPAVYINNEGKKQPRPFDDLPDLQDGRKNQNERQVDRSNPPFEMGYAAERERERRAANKREDFNSARTDFRFTSYSRSSRHTDDEVEVEVKKPQEESRDISDYRRRYAERSDRMGVSYADLARKNEVPVKKTEPVQKTQTAPAHRKYTKKEITRNRIIVLSVLAAIIMYIVLIILLCDKSAENRALKKKISEMSKAKTSVTDIVDNGIDETDKNVYDNINDN